MASLQELRAIAKNSPTLEDLESIFKEEIELHSKWIDQLKRLWKETINIAMLQQSEGQQEFNIDKSILTLKLMDESRMEDPVQAFVILSRVWKIVHQLQSYYSDQLLTKSESRFEAMLDNRKLPDFNDYEKLSDTILRLQSVYNLDVDDLTLGKVPEVHKEGNSNIRMLKASDQKLPLQMTYLDSFDIGVKAYLNREFSSAFKWFQKALELIGGYEKDKNDNNRDFQDNLVSLLDYASITAYHNGHLEYAIELTKRWLQLEPDNDRAIENLGFYEEEWAEEKRKNRTAICKKQSIGNLLDLLDDAIDKVGSGEKLPEKAYKPVNPDQYSVSEDRIVKSLCRNQGLPLSGTRTKFCSAQTYLEYDIPNSQFKIETLSQQPKILRIHDIISKEEAEHLIELAEPKLKRSTVQTKSGTKTSDFRIANTAWLSKNDYQIVKRVEDRLSKVLDLNLNDSEDLQLVNYDIGGFYGPHLDSARNTKQLEHLKDPNSTSFINGSERMTTILMYLNKVEAGGATVFPRLGLTIEPIAYSAVVWYNLKKNGYAEELTIHSGCPVMIGSKWIATKWPRDKANIFLRPCGLVESE